MHDLIYKRINKVFPKSRQAGYLMINRASVPMWGIAGKSAGPPKWAGKKSDTRPLLPAIVAGRGSSSGATDPILSTQRIPRGRDGILPTQRMGAMRQKMAIFKEGNSVCRDAKMSS